MIGVDIGGTYIRVGLVDSELHLIDKLSSPLSKFDNAETFLDYIEASVRQLTSHRQIHKIGLVFPAPITEGAACIGDATNIPFLNGYAFDRIRAHLPDAELFFENDVNAVALLESRFGEAKGCRNSLYITVSTGIGSGLIVNGQIVHGANGYAGEIGAMPMRSWIPWESEASKQKYANLEDLCSGKALESAAKSHFRLQNVEALFQKYQDGEAEICHYLDLWLENLSAGFASCVQMLDPDLVTLGGGVITHNPWLLEAIAQKTKEKIFPKMAQHLNFRMTGFDENAGLIGAASLCLTKL